MNKRVVPLIDQATVMAEDDTSVTFHIPLRLAGGPGRPMYEKFHLTARVNKQRRDFEAATLRQLTPVNMIVAKLYEGTNEITFTSVDPHFPSVQSRASAQITLKPLFRKSLPQHMEMIRADFVRITPYEELFGVKIGPLRTIEF